MSSSCTTAGVIQPPQTLSRGKTRLSRMMVSMPASCKRLAQEEPAGPPPTIRTWHESIETPLRNQLLRRTGEHESTEFAGMRSPQKRFETTAAVRHESLQSNRPDRVARHERTRVRTWQIHGQQRAH